MEQFDSAEEESSRVLEQRQRNEEQQNSLITWNGELGSLKLICKTFFLNFSFNIFEAEQDCGSVHVRLCSLIMLVGTTFF